MGISVWESLLLTLQVRSRFLEVTVRSRCLEVSAWESAPGGQCVGFTSCYSLPRRQYVGIQCMAVCVWELMCGSLCALRFSD